MGGFELVVSVIEERILVCDALILPGRTYTADTWRQSEKRPCGNLMKIEAILVNGKVAQLTAIHEADTYEEGKVVRHGCCITYGARPWSKARRFTYGPRNVVNFDFVHCKHCLKRWAWKSFKKANI
jgi:hypothetical protein